MTIYTENWGNANSSVTGNGNINLVGWTGVAVTQTAGPYLGIYGNAGANDPFLGLGLPVNTVYFTGLTASAAPTGQTAARDVLHDGHIRCPERVEIPPLPILIQRYTPT